MTPYVYILVSIIHPEYGMTTNRYCIGFSMQDRRLQGFDIDRWAEPVQRRKILSLLCEDWLTLGCDVVGCEQIAGAVQWGAA